MNSKMISVVMAVFNGEKYLISAIESILNQTYENLEFIIINDGSVDGSLSIIKEYMEKDPRVILIDQKNIGLTKSLNIGIMEASGAYISRQDADDVSLPNRLSDFMNYIKKNGDIDIYTTPAIAINQDDNILKVIPNYFRRNGFHPKMLNYFNSLIHGTLIIKSDLIKKYQYNEEFRYSQDFELYHRLIKNGYKINYDKNNLSYKFRIHNSQVSVTKKTAQLDFLEEALEKNNIQIHGQTFSNRIIFRVMDIFRFLQVNIGLK